MSLEIERGQNIGESDTDAPNSVFSLQFINVSRVVFRKIHKEKRLHLNQLDSDGTSELSAAKNTSTYLITFS